jgi:ribosome recycling factor
MSTIQQILKDCRTSMDKGIDAAKREFASVRSGKASPNMLDTVRVEMYGQQMQLNQVAGIAAPEPRTILVTPFDKGQVKAIEKAIRESDLGLEPSTQGAVIRVPLPQMNEQRRKELVKVVHKLAEEARIGIRHARTAARDQLKKLEKTSEDDQKKAEKELQKLHDDYIGRIDELLKGKEAEIMEV